MQKRRNRRKRKQVSRIINTIAKNATREGYALYFIANKLVKELTEALNCFGPESLEVAGLRRHLAMRYHQAGKLTIAIFCYKEF